MSKALSVGQVLDIKLTELQAAVDFLKKQNAELTSKQKITDAQLTTLLTLNKDVEKLKREVGQKVGFSASLGDDGDVYIGPAREVQTVPFKNVFFNNGNAYNACTGIFTAPCKGAFQFIFKTTGRPDYNSGAYLAKNDERQVSTWRPEGNGRDTATQAVILPLDAGDTVKLVNWGSNDCQLWDNGWRYSTFSGFLLFSL